MIRPASTSSRTSTQSQNSHKDIWTHSNDDDDDDDNNDNEQQLEEIKEDNNNKNSNKQQDNDTIESDDESDTDNDEKKADNKDGGVLKHLPDASEISNSIWRGLKNLRISTKRSIYQFFQPVSYLQTRGLSLIDIEELLMLYPLSKRQFCTLIDEFLRLCGIDIYDETQNDEQISSITMDELMENVYLRYVPFKTRIRMLFENDLKEDHGIIGNDDGNQFLNELTFFDFCKCLSVFAADTPKASKIRFAYRIYDMEDDGYISRENLFDVIKMIIGEKFDDDAIKSIVSDTFMSCSLNSDGNIDYQEFNSIVGIGDIAARYTIHF